MDENRQWQEKEWIAHCLQGEPQAFRFLVERYERMVRGMIRRLIVAEHEVDELAQQSFVAAYENLARFGGECRFSTWLCQIALNKARDFLRARRYRGNDMDIDELELQSEAEGPDAQLEGKQEERQRDRQLQAALRRLKPEDRELIVLKYLNGYDYETVAQMLGCTPQAAKVRSVRARDKLKEILQGMGVTS